MRFELLFLTLGVACGDAGSRHPQVIAADTASEVVGRFTPEELLAYERGRREEIAALRSGARFTPGAVDSIGARAAGLAPRVYRGLTQAVDSFLKQRLQPAAIQLTTAPMASDSLLALLDSLRVERLVLEVQIGS